MPPSPDIEAKIRAAAAAKNVDPDLAVRIAQAESSGQSGAQNPRSTAQGLFQVIDDTWKRYGGKPGKKFDVDENIRVGTDILADNTNKLRQMLGRDPQGHEVYTAHFFGPGTAKHVLTADANRPLNEILSQKVLNANPELKNQTTGEFLQRMQSKTGSKPAAATASRPAAPGSEPTASEKMMTDALKSGMSAQNLIKDAGPGYKAAMAMMFLADDKPETDKDDIWKEAEPEQTAEVDTQEQISPLASLDLSYQSPFPEQTASAKQQLAYFKDGGVVHRADGSPQEGEQVQEVKEPWLPQVSSYSELTAQDMYPGQQGQFDQRDAARHMLAAGTLARKYGPNVAEIMGKAHEITTSPLRYIGSKLGISQMPVDYEQDLHNNRIGIELAKRSKSQKDLEDLVMQMAEQHRLQQTEGKPWTGKPVRRGNGSPETGEIGPAFGNPNIQRQGAKARALAAQRNVNTLPDPKTYAAVSGFLGTPFPEQGFSVFHPQRQGIERAADVGFNLGTAAQIAPVAAPVLKGAAKLVGSGLNERMLAGQSLTPGFNTPAPVNFAVRPEGGGFFLHNQRLGIDDVDQFLRHYVGVQKESTNPLDQWMYKRYSSYMRGTMGTEMDPFVKAADQGKKLHFLDQQGTPFQPAYVDHLPYIRERMGLPKHGFATTPTGTKVEEAIDATINPMAVGEVGDRDLSLKMKELQARNPDQPVYELMHEEVRDVLKPEDLKIALSDMMRSTDLPAEYRLTQDQLNKMTLLDASEKVAQFNQYLDAKKSTQLLREAKDVPVYKAYKEDDGHRWMAPEDVMNDESSRRYVMTAGKDANWCTKSEDTCMAYGADPYRLLILSDERGKPLAQVQYENYVPDVNDWMHTLPPSMERQLRDDYMIHQIESLPEYKQWAQQNTQMNIREIKGRHNETDLQGPVLDKVRDLIRSGNWSMVDDLENAKLVDSTSLAAGRYVDMNAYEKAVKDRFGTLYLTPEEAVEAKSMVQTAPKPPEEYAKGGSVERVSGDNRRYL